jgi:hypothetical protein
LAVFGVFDVAWKFRHGRASLQPSTDITVSRNSYRQCGRRNATQDSALLHTSAPDLN